MFSSSNADSDDTAQNGADLGVEGAESEAGVGPEDEQDVQSASEDEPAVANSYASLLHSLNAGKVDGEPARKKRRIADKESRQLDEPATQEVHGTEQAEEDEQDIEAREQHEEQLDEDVEEDEEHDDLGPDADPEDDDGSLKDPFEKHYNAMAEQDLKAAAKQVDEKVFQTQTSPVDSDIRRTTMRTSIGDTPGAASIVRTAKDLFLKQRLTETGTKLASSLSSADKSFVEPMFNYVDAITGSRSIKNASHLRDLTCLHALNHVFKTRDRVLKNNARLSAQTSNTESLDLRDQGFTRPKILIIVPTKQACVHFVDSIVKLSEPDQQENKSRFLETFSHEDPDEWPDKPEDFRELFGGNHEEDFRIGLKFTRKTIKYFSGFYNSDIIFGSPLGLMRTITTGGGGSKDKKKTFDADFLSSIEVVIVDHANALQMQNWQHVDYVFSHLNLLPKDSHGCDFSRVRHWYLDGRAKYLRQTIILSDYLTPEINALASTHLFNIAGRVKLQRTYPGAMLSISSLLPTATPTPQTFLRIPSPNALTDSDTRFKFFTTTILAPMLRSPRHQAGTLVYTTSYADFVRLRNHLSSSPDAASLSFGAVSEYTPMRDVTRARAHFRSARHALLLYSERAHHHFRYRLRGVRRIVFYSVPENPLFWNEIIAFLGLDAEGNRDGDRVRGEEKGKAVGRKGVIRALFSKWDAIKLERIVGTERVGRLIHDRAGDVFEFV